MDKIATTTELRSELLRLASECTPGVSREVMAVRLRYLAARLAGDSDRRAAALKFGEPDLDTPVSGKAHLALDGYPLFDDVNFAVPQGTKPSSIIDSYLTKLLGKHKMTFVQAKTPRSTKTLDIKSAKYKVILEDGSSETIIVELSVKKT